jgi:hypothetical protein
MKSLRIPVLFLSLAFLAATAFSDPTEASTILIPKVVFRGATVREGVDFLRKKGLDLDPRKSGVNIVLIPWEGMEQVKVDLDLSNIALETAVRYFAQLAGLELTKDGETLILARKNRIQPASLISTAGMKAAQIKLPKVEFREASVEEALNFIRYKASALDAEKSGINIVLIPSDKTRQTKLTLGLLHVSAADAVKYVALVANLDIKREGETLILKGAD